MDGIGSPALGSFMMELLTIALGLVGLALQPVIVLIVRQRAYEAEARAWWPRDVAMAITGPAACAAMGIAAVVWQADYVVWHSREAIAEMAAQSWVLPFVAVGLWLALTLAFIVARRLRLFVVARAKST
jgi:hypothetical protein